MQQQVAAAVSANFVWATRAGAWLARQVATHFDEEREAVLPALRTGGAGGRWASAEIERARGRAWSLASKALTALRGGYIGVLMFGMVGTVAGLALINPFSLGAGVLLGGKTISDERPPGHRASAGRGEGGGAALRRRSRLPGRQGVTRDAADHPARPAGPLPQLADQLAASIKDSVASAERSVRTTQAEREQRLEEIPQELFALGALRDQVRTLLTMPAPSLESTMMFRAIAAPSSEPGLTTDLVPVVGHVDPAAPVPAPRARNEPPRDVPRTGGSHALRSADGRA